MPKSKIVQYDMPAPISVNDLSPEEFNNLLKDTKDHITLLSKTKFASKQIFIERLSQEKATQLTQFYSSSPNYFADINTEPGQNNTLILRIGKPLLRDLPNLDIIQNAYAQLGVQPIPFIRKNNKNIRYPDYEINNKYRIDFITPDAQTFLNILRDMKNKNIISYRFSETIYEGLPKHYYYNDVWYQLKSKSNLNALDKQQFNIFSNEINPRVLSFRDNPYAWESFLRTLPKDITERTYDSFLDQTYEKIIDKNNQDIYIYPFNNENYHILSLRQLRESINSDLKTVYQQLIIDKREPTSSLGDKVFFNIQQTNLTQNILPQNLFFKRGFLCNYDPRFEEFVETQIKKDRKKDIFTYLFSSIKSHKTVIERNGKTIHCFNLSNTEFEKIPEVKDGWSYRKNLTPQDPDFEDKKLYEFELECAETANDEMRSCTKWKCTTYTPNKDGFADSYSIFLNNNNFDPLSYSFDAVVLDSSNRIQYILEFDGSDHYYARPNTEMDITNKIVSDQIKNNFANYFSIPIKRIPFFARRKAADFEEQFQDFVLRLLSEQYVPNYTSTPETVNPGIYTKAAYKIKQIIK
jgi:hypothetical protein